MPDRRAYGFVMFLALGHLVLGVPGAQADCPTHVFTAGNDGNFVVPEGCPYMEVKVWGNGGNAGWAAASRGKGGGGAAVTAVYQVEAGQSLRAFVRENQFSRTQPAINGWASALHVTSTAGPELIVAGGGGGGGASGIINPSQTPDGGAGGARQGQHGLSALVRVGGQVLQTGVGQGGGEEAGGQGGSGYGGPQNTGMAGGRYPCYYQYNDPCGRPGYVAGVGGEGAFGGGGGGGSGPHPLSPGDDGGSGGGGGASVVKEAPPGIRLVFQRMYDGNRERPGNADDPDRNGAGQGGDPSTGSLASTPGRIVVKFLPLKILPELTTRWKPQRANTPIDVVFESPFQLQSATLEIEDPDGLNVVVVNTGSLQLMASTPLYRYKLPWIGPWTYSAGGQTRPLPAGNYTVVVRAIPADGGEAASSGPYDRVSLVEVRKVQLFADSPEHQFLDANPVLPPIVGQSPPQGRSYGPGGMHAGRRIFAEASSRGLPATKTVAIYAEIVPPIDDLPAAAPVPKIWLRSLDVDDPATALLVPNPADLDGDGDPLNVQDNRGSPRCGELAGSTACAAIEVPVASGTNSVWTTFTVSDNPGDNYRVAASTSSEWLSKLVAVQASDIGEVQVKKGSSSVPLDQAGERCVSEMLTVWRTLRLEYDTTLPIPTGANDAQRNFIEGRVTRIVPGSSSVPLKLFLQPDAVTNYLPLDDGSPNLSLGNGNGRFQNGSIRIGAGGGEQWFGGLGGNGVDYVTRASGFSIPYEFRPQAGGPAVPGFVVSWDENVHVFQVTPPVPGGPVNGSLTVASVTWSNVVANGSSITLSGSTLAPLTFRLVDDDAAAPSVPQSTYLTPFSDNDPYRNILAQAYITVRNIWGGAKTASFKRNVEHTTDKILEQLDAGRDSTTGWSNDYWGGYVQGSFQGPKFWLSPSGPEGDSDADNEVTEHVLGITLSGPSAPSPGSLIYFEVIRDRMPSCSVDYRSVVIAHEVGHQFGLDHSDPGIMVPPPAASPCPSKLYFGPNDLHKIRQFTLPN